MPTSGLDPVSDAASDPSHGEVWRLSLLFGSLSFLQSLAEPTDGLLAQPVRSLLRSRGESISEITTFAAVMALPWLFKPLFGMASDFLPLAGSRRKSYLLVSGAATALALLGAFALRPRGVPTAGLLAILTVATAAVAMSDVVTDALMVDRGKPSGLTGRYQAVQWACTYAAGLASGVIGGELSARHSEWTAFAICGAGALVSLAIIVPCVRRRDDDPGRMRAETLRLLGSAVRSRMVLAVAGFIFLWTFNPFSNAVLHLHMTGGLGLGERFYGWTVSATALASIVACLAYGLYCRRVSTVILAHASIALGVLSTLGYLFMNDRRSAVVVTLLMGFTYMTATLIQLDIAARHCPPEAAGTVFASLMALCNLASALAVWTGGQIYDRATAVWDAQTAFRVLIVISAATTACCWLLTPILPRGLLRGDDPSRR